MEPALFRADLAEGPAVVRPVWARCADDVQVRVVVWPVDEAVGTVLLLPGRTEYAEKYGRVARRLTEQGLNVATVDWRGQGLSDRLADDRLLGHVLRFTDYQKDIAALCGVIDAMALPGPRFLLAHSMGGSIGLRALSEGLPVERAVFTAPMWGIAIPGSQRALAAVLPTLARLSGQGERSLPGTRPVIYDAETGFERNPLTTDPEHFAWFARQLQSEDQFALGPPSVHWLGEALAECRKLTDMPRPDLPVLTFVGTDEMVVSVPVIEAFHADWPSAELRVVDGARHEIMMETPALRDRFFAEALAFFGIEDAT
ncbi:MAG: alpha/beta hydrolase [Silicimonas sp.]|nr:alpha/beta hydrolase [Silicimonas sp.]